MLSLIDELLSDHLGIQNRMAFAKTVNQLRYHKKFEARKTAVDSDVFRDFIKGSKLSRNVDGYGYLPDFEKSLVSRVVRDANEVISEGDGLKSNKGFMINKLQEHQLRQYSSFLDVALHPNIIRSASEYLGYVPVLSSVKVLVSSVNDSTKREHSSSQLFHLDQPDRPLFKVIVNLHDVDADSGPFTFLKKAASVKAQSVLKTGWNRRSDFVQDDDLFRIVDRDDLVELVGEAGDAYFVDSSYCFHYGSRNQKKERKILMMSYLSPCRADFRPTMNFLKFRHGASLVEKWVLDPHAVTKV